MFGNTTNMKIAIFCTIGLVWTGLISLNAQNVGIGTAIPLEKLTIGTGNLLLENSTKGIVLNGADNAMITRGFDPFTSGKHTGLGRWGLFMEPNVLTVGLPNIAGKRFAVSSYLANSTINREILVVDVNGNVGINVGSPQWTLDVNGSMQLGGRLFVNGSSGTAGQVLTSNFLSPPSWQTLSGAFDNNTRFEATFSGNSSAGLTPALAYTQVYNTNPADVIIASSGLTINKTGLYHIEGYYETFTQFSTKPNYFILRFRSVFGGRVFWESLKLPATRDESNLNQVYTSFERFSREVYLLAGNAVSCSMEINYSAGGPVTIQNNSHSGRISGYLISE